MGQTHATTMGGTQTKDISGRTRPSKVSLSWIALAVNGVSGCADQFFKLAKEKR
jgi:hypothetical protein